MEQIIRIPAFNDNYIWLITDPERTQGYVVDPGDAMPVKQALERERITLCGILITHHHFDHVGGIKDLSTPGMRVIGPDNDSIKGITETVTDGDSVNLEELGIQLDVYSVPGHTLDHIAYAGSIDGQPVLFCGDTLFSGGCGRLFEGTAEQMHSSLEQLTQLDDSTLVYCAHEYTQANLAFALAVEPGNEDLQEYAARVKTLREEDVATIPTNIGLEKNINPFLRYNEGPVLEAAAGRAGTSPAPGAQCLKIIREWKDSF